MHLREKNAFFKCCDDGDNLEEKAQDFEEICDRKIRVFGFELSMKIFGRISSN